MSITYITALYNIYQSEDKVKFYLNEFEQLCQLGLSIVVYVDDDFYKVLPRYYDNVTIITLNLNDTTIYPLLMLPLTLPSTRCLTKDTQSYLALMNTKIELIYKTKITTPYVAWIDAGILKLIKNNKNYLQTFIPYTTSITMPGCWDINPVSLDHVCWRFAGTFWFSPTSLIEPFYKLCLSQINTSIENRRIVWEVNTWANVELKFPFLFSWYKADHNDLLFNIPANFLTQFKISKTSIDGLGNVLKGFISAYSINENSKVECNDSYSLGNYDTILNEKHIFKNNLNTEPFYTCRFLILKNEENDQPLIKNEYSMYLDGCGNRKMDYLFSFKTAIDWGYDATKVSSKIKNRILSTINKIQFNPLIIDRVNQVNLIHPVLGVSVRTWTAKHETNINRSYNFDTYKNEINSQLDKVKTIVISLDQANVKNDYVDLLKDYNVIFLEQKDLNDLQYALFKVLTLARCNVLIANRLSTFSELIYWFSQCQQQVIPLF